MGTHFRVSFYDLFLSEPSASPLSVTATAVDSTSIEVTWRPPPEKHRNGNITGYRVLFTEALGSRAVDEAEVVTVPPSERSYIISHLQKYTSYQIWVQAFTRIGDGPLCDVIVVRTDEDGMSLWKVEKIHWRFMAFILSL